MWVVKPVAGDEFKVTDVEAKALIAGMESRLPVNLGYAVINGTSIASIWNEEELRVKTNRIINDENFKKWLNGDYSFVDVLNNRYSGDKYDKEWKEALEYKKKVENGEIKLLGKNDDIV